MWEGPTNRCCIVWREPVDHLFSKQLESQSWASQEEHFSHSVIAYGGLILQSCSKKWPTAILLSKSDCKQRI